MHASGREQGGLLARGLRLAAGAAVRVKSQSRGITGRTGWQRHSVTATYETTHAIGASRAGHASPPTALYPRWR